jgi:hypothetical protein
MAYDFHGHVDNIEHGQPFAEPEGEGPRRWQDLPPDAPWTVAKKLG